MKEIQYLHMPVSLARDKLEMMLLERDKDLLKCRLQLDALLAACHNFVYADNKESAQKAYNQMVICITAIETL